MMDEKRKILRHFLAALVYRIQKVAKDAPANFANFRIAPGVRTPHEIVWHITSVLGYARTFFIGGTWRPEKKATFQEEIQRLHEIVERLGEHLEQGTPFQGTTPERMLQGPFSDAMTHVGQLAMLRRLFGSPVPPENFMMADITADNLGSHQAAPVNPDKDWYDAEGRPQRLT